MLTTVDEFEVRLGRALDVDERLRATAALGDASDLVLAVGDGTWTDATVPAAVVGVVLRAARRQFDNPTGAGQMSVGDVSVSYPQRTFLTRADEKVVRRAAGKPTAVTLVSPYNVEDV